MEDRGRSAFGTLLRRLRLEVGLSQEALAERARMSVKTVSALESGARRAPYRETVTLLADGLGLGPQDRAHLEAAGLRPQRPRLRLVDTATQGALALRAVPDPRATVALGAMDAPPHNLPSELSSLLGRDDVIAEVGALVEAHRLVSLVGTGGIGKTRLSLRVAENLLNCFVDDVWFVELAPVRQATLVTAAIAQALGIGASERGLLELIVGYLKCRKSLLVLDNCEHVIDDARAVTVKILRECPEVRVVASSREPLNVTGEWVYRVPSLPYPAGSPANSREAAGYASMALFAERAQAGGGFTLSDENVSAVAEICRRVDGIPLAIELAAARAKVLAPRQLAQLLGERFHILTRGNRDSLPRRQTMRSTIDWSYALLSEQERLLFDRLSVFVGGFTLEPATRVCSNEDIDAVDVLDLLSSLVDKSLVVADRTGEQTRFRLLESARDFGRERLLERGEEQRLARRHAEAFLDLAERNGEKDQDRQNEMRREQDNWIAALAWSLGAGHDALLGQRLTVALQNIYMNSNPSLLPWMRMALNSVDADTQPAVVARLEFHWALWQGSLGRHEEALSAARRAIVISQDLGDQSTLADARRQAALALAHLGQTDEAEALSRQVVSELRRLGDRRGASVAMATILEVLRLSGDLAGARSLYADAMRLCAEVGRDPLNVAGMKNEMACIEHDFGDTEAALRYEGEAVAIVRELGHPALWFDLSNMAAYSIALGRYDDAREQALESLELARGLAIETLMLYPLQRLAAVAALRRHDDPTAAYDDRTRAARLIGFVDARVAASGGAQIREPMDERERDRMLTSLRESVGDDELQRLMGAGSAMSARRAIDLASRP